MEDSQEWEIYITQNRKYNRSPTIKVLLEATNQSNDNQLILNNNTNYMNTSKDNNNVESIKDSVPRRQSTSSYKRKDSSTNLKQLITKKEEKNDLDIILQSIKSEIRKCLKFLFRLFSLVSLISWADSLNFIKKSIQYNINKCIKKVDVDATREKKEKNIFNENLDKNECDEPTLKEENKIIKERCKRPKEVKDMLKNWLLLNKDNLHPPKEKKIELANKTNLSIKQIDSWLKYQRQKSKKNEQSKLHLSIEDSMSNYSFSECITSFKSEN